MLCAHLKMGKIKRPLLEGKSGEELRAFITSQLAQREQYYMQAKHVFDVSLLDNFEKIHASVAQLRELLDL